MLKAVLFDMDGVIIDSEPFHYKLETKLHTMLGITIPQEIRKGFVGLANNKMWEFIKTTYHLNQSVEELIAFSHQVRTDDFNTLQNLTTIPGIIELLQTLKENTIKTAIASSSPPNIIELFISKLNLHAYFDVLISGDSVANGKPEPDIFLHAAHVLHVLPSECIVIEDSTNGVKSALAANMMCIGYHNPNSGEQNISPAHLIVNDFTKLKFEDLERLV